MVKGLEKAFQVPIHWELGVAIMVFQQEKVNTPCTSFECCVEVMGEFAEKTTFALQEKPLETQVPDTVRSSTVTLQLSRYES